MISVYIHIPFCSDICTYCDFCKFYYNKKWVDLYLNELSKEIKTTYQGEKVKTLYIGGGTPTSLSVDELRELFEILNLLDLKELEEFTIECNVENLTHDKIDLFKEQKIKRLSIGIQTFNKNYLSFINRKHSTRDVFSIIEYAKEKGFDNINVDLMYGLPDQTMEELKDDLNKFVQLDVVHISTYSLIIEEHTKLFIEHKGSIDEDLNYEMYQYINHFLADHNYIHYEISNYAKVGYESKHNFTYWNNDHYYGFGLGASSYVDNTRYSNTRSLSNYLKGNYVLEKQLLTKKETMENEMILGLRKLEGVNKCKFTHKFGLNINDVFDVKDLLTKQHLKDNGEFLYIPEDKMFISNEILINFID